LILNLAESAFTVRSRSDKREDETGNQNRPYEVVKVDEAFAANESLKKAVRVIREHFIGRINEKTPSCICPINQGYAKDKEEGPTKQTWNIHASTPEVAKETLLFKTTIRSETR
jgi:hypothetical protein